MCSSPEFSSDEYHSSNEEILQDDFVVSSSPDGSTWTLPMQKITFWRPMKLVVMKWEHLTLLLLQKSYTIQM